MSKGWDNTTLKKLKALTGKGLSTSEIGKRLGMSKNAIVGKLNRLGWNSKAGGVDGAVAKPAVAKKTKVSVVVKKSAPVKKVAVVGKDSKEKTIAKKATPGLLKNKSQIDKKPIVSQSIHMAKSSKLTASKNLVMHQRIVQHSLSMAGLKSNQCRWPQGDPDSESFHFCGDPVFVGKPYCYEHCKQAYQFTPVKKK